MMRFDPVAAVFVITMGERYIFIWQFFFRLLYLFDSIFSEIIWIDKLHNFMDGIYFLTMVAMEIGKDNFLVTIATFVSREEKALSKPWIW